MLSCVIVFLGCVLLSMIFTWTVRRVACDRGWVVAPQSSRHLHKKAVPRLGGVAIFSSFVLSMGALGLVFYLLRTPMPFNAGTMLRILIPAALVFAIGLWDDIRPLPAIAKFGVQIAAGALLFAGGIKIAHVRSLFSSYEFGWLTGLVATIFWVVWITNAFNLIDGVDGLASGSALLSTLVLFLNALITHDTLTLFITAALAGGILGFLRYNFNPATIFLGDCGSLFIGFSLSALALAQTQKAPTLAAVCLPLVALGLPILDTVLSVARRFISGKPLFSADREHIHHKLLEKGLTQRQVVMILYGVSGAFGLVALFLRYPGGRFFGAILVILGVVVVFAVQKLGYVEVFELRRVAQRTIEQRQIIINNLSLRRAHHALAGSTDFASTCSILQQAFGNNDFHRFKLVVTGAAVKAGSHPMRLQGADLVFEWSQQGFEEVPGWEIRLELITNNCRKIGDFFVTRQYGDRSLMLDVNLLTREFPSALASAVERSMAGAKSKPNSVPVARAAVVLSPRPQQ